MVIISDATNEFLPGDNKDLLNRIELNTHMEDGMCCDPTMFQRLSYIRFLFNPLQQTHYLWQPLQNQS